MEGGYSPEHSNKCKSYNLLRFQVEALPSPRSYANGATLGGIFHVTGFIAKICPYHPTHLSFLKCHF